jgi:hypothetical protein
MTAPPSDPRVDELRQRLRSLGYLDAGVDRFVLAPARSTRPPSTIALLASLRIGALAALLLGPAAAIGLSARMPGLVTGPKDALVVAVYLGTFFGVAVAVAAFVASLIVSWLARRSGLALGRRGQTLSRIAGAVVTLLVLGYLTLWWRTVIAGLGWSAPLWTVSALAIAAAISLLLGHSVRVGSSAVVLVSGPEHGSFPGADTSPDASPYQPAATRRRTWPLAGAVAFGAAALLLTLSGSTDNAPAETPALTVVPSGVRIKVIAIDGFDARIFEELSASGRVGALTSAFQGTLVRLDPRQAEMGDPARVWTTIATGEPPEVHGVQGLETRRVAGVQGRVPSEERSAVGRAIRGATDLVRLTRPAIASGTERRSKTFWEVASAAGLRTVVVNWWATWPADTEAGNVLTDRATLRLEHGGNLDAEIAPAALYERLRQQWPSIKARATQRAAEALKAPADTETRALLQRSAELDAIQLVLLASVTSADTDLSAVYLPGLDIVQHAILGLQNAQPGGEQERVAASALAARLDALKEYYVVLDHLLSPLLTPEPDELLMVVTAPGRVRSESGSQLVARGGAVRAASRLDGSQTDVAPTILYALGVPISRALGGAPLINLLDQRFIERYPVRFVATYGSPAQKSALRSGTPLDQEMIDRLRSLGYVR